MQVVRAGVLDDVELPQTSSGLIVAHSVRDLVLKRRLQVQLILVEKLQSCCDYSLVLFDGNPVRARALTAVIAAQD